MLQDARVRNVIKGNNTKVMDYISRRLDIGNVKFGKEMPLDGTYNLEDVLEEAVDMALYLTALILYMKDNKDA